MSHYKRTDAVCGEYGPQWTSFEVDGQEALVYFEQTCIDVMPSSSYRVFVTIEYADPNFFDILHKAIRAIVAL